VHLLGYRARVLKRFFPYEYKVCILLLTAVSTVHRCILFVGMFSILVYIAVSAVQVFIVYTRVFPKMALLWQWGEIYRRERASRFIQSVV